MIQVSEGKEALEINSPMRPATRVVFVLIALVPLLAPYELMLRVQWTDYGHPFFLVAATISAGALAVSGLLVFAAAAGLSSRMTLDAARSTFTYLHGAPCVPYRTQVRPLSTLEGVQVRTHEWSDGAPSYSITVAFSDGTTFDSGASWSLEGIERDRARIDAFLDRIQHR
jgi:hypothetical protein